MIAAQTQAERAYDQVIEWLERFDEVEDPRQSGKVAYPLEEMLLRCLLAVLAGADSWVEIAEFGRKKLDFPRRFRAFEQGTPSHDRFGNLFAALDTEAFQSCFIAWVASLTKLGPDIVANRKTVAKCQDRRVSSALHERLAGVTMSILGRGGHFPANFDTPLPCRGLDLEFGRG